MNKKAQFDFIFDFIDTDVFSEIGFWALTLLGWIGGIIVWAGFFQVGKVGELIDSLGGGDITFSLVQKFGALAILIIGVPIASYVIVWRMQ